MKLIHLSDLHFGTEESGIVNALESTIKQITADMVIVSGDFTQVASAEEFLKAQDFMKRLGMPVFCVPGNHDVPPLNLWERFLSPYKKYKRYIHPDLCPVFDNDTVVIAGLNSARRMVPHWNWANGAISGTQLAHLKKVYESHDPNRTKLRICVFHHPVQKALNAPLNTVVFGAKKALSTLNELEVGLVLTGHVHHASVTTLGDINHKTVYLSASTALSSRLREQENGFNVIEIQDQSLDIRIHSYDGQKFQIIENYKQA